MAVICCLVAFSASAGYSQLYFDEYILDCTPGGESMCLPEFEVCEDRCPEQ